MLWQGSEEGTTVDVLILFWEDHEVYRFGLPPALERLGHRVWIPTPHERGSGLARMLAARRPELVLSMGWTGWSADQTALALLQDYCTEYRVPHIYWSTEDPLHTTVWVEPHIGFVQPDVVLTVSPRTVDWYRQLGIRAEELPFAAAVDLHKPSGQPSTELVDVALVATLYGSTGGPLRNPSLSMLLRPLLGRGWTVRIFGHGWETAEQQLGLRLPPQWIQPPVPYQAVPGLYNTARIVLGPQNDANQLTSRTFETIGTGGGVLLTVRTPGVSRYFREGRDLLACGSSKEALALIQRYLPDDSARRRIRDTGRRTVMDQHTYEHRAAFIIRLAHEFERAPGPRAAPPILRQICGLSPRALQSLPPASPLELPFHVPDPPAGYTLKGARLECFADTVSRPGVALCANQDRCVLDAQYVSVHSSDPYPYPKNWFSWDVREEFRGQHPRALTLRLIPEPELSADWVLPGTTSVHEPVRHHLRAFLPRVCLLWTRR